jgi:hypothetical protein
VKDPAYWDMTAQLGGLDTIKSRKAKLDRGELVGATGNREPPSKAAKGDGKRFPIQQGPASSSSGSGRGAPSSWEQMRRKWKEDRSEADRKWKEQRRK